MPDNSRAPKKLSPRQQQELDVEIEFLEGLVRRDPEYVEALQLLGNTYTRRGRPTDGMRVDEQLSRLQPENPVVHYNLACSCALTGQMDRAAGALQRALDLGFHDFQWLVRDPDLQRLREHPAYQRIAARLRAIQIHIG